MKPKLRFKEFTDDWKEKKLEEIAENFIGGGTPNTKVPEYWNGDIAWIQSSDIDKNSGKVNVEKHISDKALKNSAAKLIPSSSIAVVTRVGVGKVALLNHEYSTSQDFLSFVNVYGNPQYWFYEISKLMYKQSFYLQGTSIKGITKSEILNISTFCPSLPEQEKIGTFLSLVDQRIEKQERKVALLEEEKKGYMQQIFNQELRFKDEEGNNYPDWKEKKLKEISTSKGGTALEKYVNDYGRYYFVSIGNYGINGKYIDNGQRIDLTNKTKEKLLEKNDLVMILNDKTSSGSILGTCILIPENNKYIYNQRSQRIILNNDIFPLYAYYYLNYPFRKKIVRQAQGGTQIYVNYSSVENTSLKIPSLPEQEKIANFLSLLDQRIEKEQEKLRLLKEEKKGLLQQMFV